MNAISGDHFINAELNVKCEHVRGDEKERALTTNKLKKSVYIFEWDVWNVQNVHGCVWVCS